MYSQLFITKAHSVFLIFTLFHTYITISAPYQRDEKVVLSMKHPRVDWGSSTRGGSPRLLEQLLCTTTTRLTSVTSAADHLTRPVTGTR